MIRRALLALGLLCSAGPLAAQNIYPADTALDADHAAQRDVFVVLRDSTSSISAASARLMTEMGPSASLPWLQARARGVAQACARSVAPLAQAQSAVSKADWLKPYQKKPQAELLKAMSVFHPQLLECTKQWTAMAADTSQTRLRDNAPHAMSVLESQVTDFNRAAQLYLQYISVKLPLPKVK
jgi:hypothetical protein